MSLTFPTTVPFEASSHRAFLETIQGNILKGHGRSFTRLLFFKCDRARTKPKVFFREVVEQALVTSAWTQREQAANKQTPSGFYSLMLTKEFFYTFAQERFPAEIGGAFKAGAFDRMGGWKTIDAWKNWFSPYRRKPHGLWLLAHDEKTELDAMEQKITNFLTAHGARLVQGKEHGLRWHEARDRSALREPFGFRDGISQANFIKPDPAATATVQIGLDRVFITRDAATTAPTANGGSFFVIQKLEQNVQAFRAFEAKLARAYTDAKQTLPARDAGALLVGRERDGSPLVSGAVGPTNQFDYANDIQGRRCPFHAHIRKANPRGAASTETAERVLARQFVRRSAVYDDRGLLPKHASPNYPEGNNISGNVGLLFMGYMADITEQFEHIRLTWLQSPTFPSAMENLPDPLLHGGSAPDKTWWWQQGGGVKARGLSNFVANKGALFCYVPTLEWLKKF